MPNIRITILSILAVLSLPTFASAQNRGALASDSAQVSHLLGRYLRANFAGRIGFDSSLSCRNGLLCVENEQGKKPEREQQRRHVHESVVAAANGVIIPFSKSATCDPPTSENCHLASDYYIRIWEPFFDENGRSFIVFDVSRNAKQINENRVYGETHKAFFTKSDNHWALDSVAVIAIR